MNDYNSKQTRNVLIFIFLITCVMFYFAVDIWIRQEDACAARMRFCTLSKSISELTGVASYKVTAQIWGALGLMMLFIQYLSIRNYRKDNKKMSAKPDRMK